MKNAAAIRNSATSTDSLLALAQQGDEQAFTQIVRAHKAMVYGLARNMCSDAHLADDIAQEVFLKLFKRLDKIQSEAHLVFWLRKVACNCSIDVGRRIRRFPVGAEVEKQAAPQVSKDVLMSGLLQELMAQLPPKQRMVVVLRHQEEIEPAEIAEILDVPLNTVKSQLQRALTKLRDELERRGAKVDQ